MRAVNSGGNWNNGANVSPLYWNGNNSPTDTNINIGARAVICTIGQIRETLSHRASLILPKGEITRKAGLLVAEILRRSTSVQNDRSYCLKQRVA